jgi:hypothetical protein
VLGAGVNPGLDLPDLVLWVGMILLSWGLLRWRWHRRSGARPGEALREDFGGEGRREAERVQETVQRSLVELHEIVRTMNGRLETKIRLLDRLCREADERAARLESLAGASPPPKGAGAPRPLEGAQDDRYRQIYAYADAGLDVTEIAQKVKKDKGEVRLILDLRRPQ